MYSEILGPCALSSFNFSQIVASSSSAGVSGGALGVYFAKPVSQSPVFISQSVFSANSAAAGMRRRSFNVTPGGGSVYFVYDATKTTSPFSVTSTTFTDTSTTGEGGSIAIHHYDVVTSSSFAVSLSSFTRASGSSAGAIALSFSQSADHSPSTFTSSTFSSCSAVGFYAGAVYINHLGASTDNSVVFTNCIFLQNTAVEDGGSIYLTSSSTVGNDDVSILSCSFVSSQSTSANGGAASILYGSTSSTSNVDLLVSQSTFSSCFANTGLGGAISVVSTAGTVVSANTNTFYALRFTDCVGGSGGAISLAHSGIVTNWIASVTSSNFTQCSAVVQNGGSLHFLLTGTSTHTFEYFNALNFLENTAQISGGSIYSSFSGTVVDHNVTLSNNNFVSSDSLSGNGGGASIGFGSTPTSVDTSRFEVFNTKWTGCNAYGYGGGLSIVAGISSVLQNLNFMLHDSAFRQCSGGVGGGSAFYFADQSSTAFMMASVYDTTFDSCVGTSNAGGLEFINNGDVLDSAYLVTRVNFTSCSAQYAGANEITLGTSGTVSNSDITISHVRFSSCQATVDGGAMRDAFAGSFISSSYTLESVTFEDSSAVQGDGGCYTHLWFDVASVLDSTFLFTTSTFSNCSSGLSGGGYLVRSHGVNTMDSSNITFSELSFTNCQAGAAVGGLGWIFDDGFAVSSTNVLVTNDAFSQCSANGVVTAGAGAQLEFGGPNTNLDLLMTTLTFTNGFSGGDGSAYGVVFGGLTTDQSSVRVTNVNVTNGNAIGNGAAVFGSRGLVSHTTILMDNSNFASNIAANGGSVRFDYNVNSDLEFSSITFLNNHFTNSTSRVTGGSHSLDFFGASGFSTLLFQQNTFASTHAISGYGGAVSIFMDGAYAAQSYSRKNNVTFYDVTVTDSDSYLSGGGLDINVHPATWLHVENVDFLRTTAFEQGGALSVSSSAPTLKLSVYHTTFTETRSSASSGGAVHIRTYEDSINNNILLQSLPFVNCIAASDGGAIYTQFDKDTSNMMLQYSDLTFTQINATSGVIAFWNHGDINSGSSLLLDQISMTQNKARVGAGLFAYIESMTNSQFVLSNFNSQDNTADFFGGSVAFITAHLDHSQIQFTNTIFNNTNVLRGSGAAIALGTTEVLSSNITIENIYLTQCNASSGVISLNQRSYSNPLFPGFVNHPSHTNKQWDNSALSILNITMDRVEVTRGPIDVNLRDTLATGNSYITVSSFKALFNRATSTVGVASFAFAPQMTNAPANQESGITLVIRDALFMNNTADLAVSCLLVDGFTNVLLENVMFRNNTAPSGNLLSIYDGGSIMFSNVTMYVVDATEALLTPFMTISNCRNVSVVSNTLRLYSRTSNVYAKLHEWQEVSGSLSSTFANAVTTGISTLGTVQQLHVTAVQCPYGFFTPQGGDLRIYQGQSMNSSTDVCLPCPTNAECSGASVSAASGFWRCTDQSSGVSTVQCPSGLCVGNNQCGENFINPQSQNVLCSKCVPGYIRVGTTCIECDKNSGWVLFVAINIILLITYLWLCIQSYTFMNYTQTLFLVFGPLSSLNPILDITFMQPISVAKYFCLDITSTVDTMAARLIIPLLYIGCASVALFVYNLQTGGVGRYVSVMWRIWLVLLYVLFQTLAEQAMQFLTFVRICSLGLGLSEHPDMVYYSPQHLPFFAAGIVIIIVLILLMWKLYYFLKYLDALRVKQPLTLRETCMYEGARWLTLPFKQKYYMWHLFEYVRRTILLLGYVVLWRYDIERSLWLAAWILIFAVFQSWMLPWKRYRDNVVDSVAWFILAFLAVAELTVYASDRSHFYVYGVEIAALVMILFVVIFGVKLFAEPAIRFLNAAKEYVQNTYIRITYSRAQRKERLIRQKEMEEAERKVKSMEKLQRDAERRKATAAMAAASSPEEVRDVPSPAPVQEEFTVEFPNLKSKLRPSRVISEEIAASKQEEDMNPILAAVFENRHRRQSALEELENRTRVVPKHVPNEVETGWSKDLLRQALPVAKPEEESVAPWTNVPLRSVAPVEPPVETESPEQEEITEEDLSRGWGQATTRHDTPKVILRKESSGYLDVLPSGEKMQRRLSKSTTDDIDEEPAAWTAVPLKPADPVAPKAIPVATFEKPKLKAPKLEPAVEQDDLDAEWALVRNALKQADTKDHLDIGEDQTREELTPAVRKSMASPQVAKPTVSTRAPSVTRSPGARGGRAAAPWARSVQRKTEAVADPEADPDGWRTRLASKPVIRPAVSEPTPPPAPLPAVDLKPVKRPSKPNTDAKTGVFAAPSLKQTGRQVEPQPAADDDIDDDDAADALEDAAQWSRLRK